LVLELALEKERASLLAKLSVSLWASAKEPVSRSDSKSESGLALVLELEKALALALALALGLVSE